MPCYLEENVDRQRGAGVYRSSIAALLFLNEAGYGIDPALPLDLVYNPGGAGLPPGQSGLEIDYRRELRARHGVEFTHLLTMANLPLGRFGDGLRREGRGGAYLEMLQRSFNPRTVPRLMCRSQVEVAWDGRLFDCDFNLAFGLPVAPGVPGHVSRFDPGLSPAGASSPARTASAAPPALDPRAGSCPRHDRPPINPGTSTTARSSSASDRRGG
jgi:radical SAM/Cys-rich protein